MGCIHTKQVKINPPNLTIIATNNIIDLGRRNEVVYILHPRNL